MLKLWTKSGSLYEVDEDRKRIRRSGPASGCRTGVERCTGQWRTYDEISYGLGRVILIVWPPTGEPLRSGEYPSATTLTTVVQKIGYDYRKETLEGMENDG